MTPSQLRENLYRILDQVLETGEAVEVVRHGKILRIVPPVDRFSHHVPLTDLIVGDPEQLLNLDWSSEWRPSI